MATRILSGILLLPLLAIILIGKLPLYLLGLILTIIAIYEFTNALKVKNINVCPKLGYLLSFIFFFKNIFDINIKLTTYLIMFFIISIIIMQTRKKQEFKGFLINLVGIMYIIFGFDAIVAIINNFNDGQIYIWLVFIVAILSDTMAYFVGSIFGKHKLVPRLSPKKTIEGSIGAVIFSFIGCTLFGNLFSLNEMAILIISISGSVISQIGDLLASAIKRYVGIKDYGNLIPGHGGILDRFDSIILVSQYIYLILTILNIK